MTAKKGDAKPKKREAKVAEKAAAKKDSKSKTPSKGKKNPSISPSHWMIKWWNQILNNHFYEWWNFSNFVLSHLRKTCLTNSHTFLNAAKGKSAGKDDKPEKKTRKKRDVDAPKKPMSAFFWYQ